LAAIVTTIVMLCRLPLLVDYIYLHPFTNARMAFVLLVTARYRPGQLHKAVSELALIVRAVPEINDGCGNDGS
jgi:hypothetical protein